MTVVRGRARRPGALSFRSAELDTAARVGWVDAVRGLAVLLMVLDHALLASGAPNLLRYGPTRFALPLFGLAAGAAWSLNRCPSWQRTGELLAGSLIVAVCHVAWPAFGWPDPLVLWILAGLVAPAIVRFPASSLVVTALLVLYAPAMFPANVYPLPIGAMWAAFGVLAVPGAVHALRVWSPRRWPAWMEWLGRHAFGVYVGHVCVLATLIVATR